MRLKSLCVALCLLWLSGVALSQVPKTEDWTLLHEAVLNGDVARVRELLKRGADVNAATHSGITPMMLAVGDLAKLDLLLKHGAHVNAMSAEGKSALLLAATQKRALPSVRLLLRKGARVNQSDQRGATALLMAARNGDVEVLHVLLAHGADIHAQWRVGSVPFENETSALNLACNSHSVAAVKLLLERGARFDQSGRPLLFAAMNGSLEMARLLLAAGAPVNVADSGGYTPLMHAALTEYNNLPLIELLLAHGADAQATAHDGQTPFNLARRKGWLAAVALLQPKGVSE